MPALPADSQQQQARLLQRALALLLQLQFHPATEAASQLCQCLSVFFEVFAAAAEANRLQLAAACLPAGRQCLHVVAKKHPAPLLVKYVLQLLQQAQLREAAAAAEEAEGSGAVQRGSTGEDVGVVCVRVGVRQVSAGAGAATACVARTCGVHWGC